MRRMLKRLITSARKLMMTSAMKPMISVMLVAFARKLKRHKLTMKELSLFLEEWYKILQDKREHKEFKWILQSWSPHLLLR
jgi:hypothetical protein